MQDQPTERKHALIKIAAGDYVLLSNDAQTLWRIESYEDGPSYGLTDWPRDRTLWRLLRWTGDVGVGAYIDLGDRDRWEGVEDWFERRADAIEAALKQEAPDA